MNDWLPIVAGLLGAGGFGGIIAYFVAPASERLSFRRKDKEAIYAEIARLREDVDDLKESNRNLTAAVAVLIQHDESLRERILQLDPNAKIPTTEEILKRIGVSLKYLFELKGE